MNAVNRTFVKPTVEPILVGPTINGSSLKPCERNHDQAYENLLAAAHQLIDRIHKREEELRKLLCVTENINRGLSLEEILEFVYRELRGLVPFNRIGFALIDEAADYVIARWAHSDRPVCLPAGFQAPLAGSTLEQIVRTGCPRIINDLQAYLVNKPQSRSTELITTEGMRSSLTCPLIVRSRPVGFLFFSSDQVGTYSDLHVDFFQQIAGQLAVIVEKGRLYSELAEQAAVIDRQNRQLTKELEMARRLQRALIPQGSPAASGLDTAFLYEPAIQIGGDIIDLLVDKDGSLLAFVGDAMGHGVEAAMLMAATKTALHSAVHTSSNPSEVLGLVNRELWELIGDRFVTAACARFDVKTRSAVVALAGHMQPFHFNARTGELTRPGDSGLPLGVKATEMYASVRCSFEPGDSIVFFTDGIMEATDPHGSPYGEERLGEQIRQHGQSDAAALLHAIEVDLQTHIQQAVYKDDYSALAVRATLSVAGTS